MLAIPDETLQMFQLIFFIPIYYTIMPADSFTQSCF